MSVTLFDLTYRVGRELGLVSEGTATGGSATTIVDTVERTEADDFWNGGTAWILYDAGGAGAAPQGEVKKITDFSAASDTITTQAFSAAIAAGDRYAVARNLVPLEILIQKVNQALLELGPVPLYNVDGVVIAAGQTEYTLPPAIRDIRRISYQTKDDADDNRWRVLDNSLWEIQVNNAAGQPDTLIFKVQMPTGYNIKIDYVAEHPPLYAASDALADSVPPELVIYPAAAECLRYRAQRTGWQREFVRDMERYMALAEKMRQSRGLRNIIPKKGRLVIIGDAGVSDESAPDHIYLNG